MFGAFDFYIINGKSYITDHVSPFINRFSLVSFSPAVGLNEEERI